MFNNNIKYILHIVCLALTVTTDDVVGKLTSDEEVLFDQKLSSIYNYILLYRIDYIYYYKF